MEVSSIHAQGTFATLPKLHRNTRIYSTIVYKGRTYLLYKSGETTDPKNYRPITCLPTVYKLFTSVVACTIYDHIAQHNVLATEQNGCRKDARGCKELLITHKIVCTQVKKKQRNVSIGWVDYRKEFDSVLILGCWRFCASIRLMLLS